MIKWTVLSFWRPNSHRIFGSVEIVVRLPVKSARLPNEPSHVSYCAFHSSLTLGHKLAGKKGNLLSRHVTLNDQPSYPIVMRFKNNMSDDIQSNKILIKLIQSGLSMTSWSIHIFFVLVDPYLFNAVKRERMDHNKKQTKWINQGVIDSPHCVSIIYTWMMELYLVWLLMK